MLTADELGEKGQARFREICADAQLVCNQSNRDRTGWDFVVEFPFEAAIGEMAPLESRKVPLSCHVQVKTLLEKNDRFQMRLSSAERLAKELKPAFVYVFKVNDTLQFTGAHLIHVLDKPLGKILKRLRKEDADGNSAPNKKTISMSASEEGITVAPTGQRLRESLLTACGTDLRAYAIRKSEQLAKLGFEKRPYELTVSLHAGGPDDLVDVFLGLKKDIPASNISSVQTRFGIRLPVPGLSGSDATFSIQPSPADTCTITVRSDPLSKPAVFKGDLFVPYIPGLPPEQRKFLIKTELFSLTFSKNTYSINSAAVSDIPLQTPSTWASYWRLALVMATGQGTIQIKSDTHPINLTLNVDAKADALNPNACKHLVSLCEKVSSVIQFVGVTDEPKLSIEAISDNANQIATAHALIHPDKGPVKFSFESIYEGQIANELLNMDMLHVNFLALGSVTIGYYGLMHVTGTHHEDRIKWQSDNASLKRMEQLHSFPQQYKELIETAKNETGCINVISRPFEQ